MKKLMTSSIMIIALLLMSFNITENVSKISVKSIEGTWKYSVSDAPYEYQKGELTFSEDKGELLGFAKINDYKIELKKVTLKKNKVSFYVYIEGDQVSFDIDFTEKSFKGMASYYNGELEISGKKKK